MKCGQSDLYIVSNNSYMCAYNIEVPTSFTRHRSEVAIRDVLQFKNLEKFTFHTGVKVS